jgi:hypothetical protein
MQEHRKREVIPWEGKEVTRMKARMVRIALALGALGLLVAVLGAGKKW